MDTEEPERLPVDWDSLEAEMAPTCDDVSSWLALLNNPEFNREPEEHYMERAFRIKRDERFPQYSKAVLYWPENAERHWSHTKEQAIALFDNATTYNFMQWAITYAQEFLPTVYGSRAMFADAELDLTSAVCDGSVSPLHMAAILGLPSMCRHLIKQGYDVNKPGLFGPPLVCALLGIKAFVTWTRLDGEVILLEPRPTNDHGRVVLDLMDAGAKCGPRCLTIHGQRASIAGLAFFFALNSRLSTIFSRAVLGCGDLDEAFLHFLQEPSLLDLGLGSRDIFLHLLSKAFDFSLSPNTYDEPWQNSLRQKLYGLTAACGYLKSRCDANIGSLEHLDRQQLVKILRLTLIEGDFAGFKRLAQDPRFDPNMSIKNLDTTDGTILHFAVGGDDARFVSLLVGKGADLEARDSLGRTPLMVVESCEILAMLVRKGASTQDTDSTGRNIWHLCAATNDRPLLTWLAENDPHKEQNLLGLTAAFATPLAEAFDAIISNFEDHGSPPTEPPYAARLLVEECLRLPTPGRSLLCPWPLLHFAVRLGDLQLLNGLAKLGAHCLQRDHRDRTIYDYLDSGVPIVPSHKWRACQSLDKGIPSDLFPRLQELRAALPPGRSTLGEYHES